MLAVLPEALLLSGFHGCLGDMVSVSRVVW
jgi:hypothetical protein